MIAHVFYSADEFMRHTLGGGGDLTRQTDISVPRWNKFEEMDV